MPRRRHDQAVAAQDRMIIGLPTFAPAVGELRRFDARPRKAGDGCLQQQGRCFELLLADIDEIANPARSDRAALGWWRIPGLGGETEGRHLHQGALELLERQRVTFRNEYPYFHP
jgi:hypothetical protein